jgi:hypothetical protein
MRGQCIMIWYGAWSGRTVPTDKMTPPNTPRRCRGRCSASSEIGPILKAGISSKAFPIYWGGAAERQGVRRLRGRSENRICGIMMVTMPF